MQIKLVWKEGIFLHIASLSKELLQGLLRGKLGFNGMITTDVTNMVAVRIPLVGTESEQFT